MNELVTNLSIRKVKSIVTNDIVTVPAIGGVFGDLLDRNSSTDIFFKLGNTQDIGANGNWASGQLYFKGDQRTYPTGSTWEWKCLEDHTSSTSNAPISPTLVLGSKWKRQLAPEMIQRSLANPLKYYRTTMQMPVNCVETGWSKYKTAEYGTFTPSRFSFPAAQANYDSNGVYFTLTGSFTLPTAVGQSKSATIDAGRTIANSSSLGTCTNTFVIPTAANVLTPGVIEPVFMWLDLPGAIGQSLQRGDEITLYGNGTNMVACGVIVSNNLTGRTKVFTKMSGGSGTFSSWTVKKEKLHLFFRGADITKYFFGAVQTYVTGTGAITWTTIQFLGAATAADFFGEPAMKPLDPDNSQSLSFNRSVAPLGCSSTGQFYGTSNGHVSRVSSAGTGARYCYTGGPLAPSESDPNWEFSFPDDVVIDLYASATDSGSTQGFNNLKTTSGLQSEGIVANPHQFICVSVTSASLASTNASFWWSATTNSSLIKSIDSYWNFDLWVRDLVNGYLGFAGTPQEGLELINIYGTPPATWPYHGDHTENNLVYICVVDGVTINIDTLKLAENRFIYQYQSFTEMVLNQSGIMLHDVQPGNFINYSSIHTLNRSGLEFYFNQTVNFTMPFDQGYSGLGEFSDQAFQSGISYIISDNGEIMYCPTVLDLPVEMTNTFAGQQGYVAVLTNGHAMGFYYLTPEAIWRMNSIDRGQHELEHRSPAQSGGGSKMRIRNRFNTTVAAGTNIIYHQKFLVGGMY